MQRRPTRNWTYEQTRGRVRNTLTDQQQQQQYSGKNSPECFFTWFTNANGKKMDKLMRMGGGQIMTTIDGKWNKQKKIIIKKKLQWRMIDPTEIFILIRSMRFWRSDGCRPRRSKMVAINKLCCIHNDWKTGPSHTREEWKDVVQDVKECAFNAPLI